MEERKKISQNALCTTHPFKTDQIILSQETFHDGLNPLDLKAVFFLFSSNSQLSLHRYELVNYFLTITKNKKMKKYKLKSIPL